MTQEENIAMATPLTELSLLPVVKANLEATVIYFSPKEWKKRKKRQKAQRKSRKINRRH